MSTNSKMLKTLSNKFDNLAKKTNNAISKNTKRIPNNRNNKKKSNKKKGNRRKFNNGGDRSMNFSGIGQRKGGVGVRDSKTVKHKEELGVVTSSINFGSYNYEVNPGLAAMFPWCSNEAKQWEKYKFQELVIEYTPMVTPFDVDAKGRLIFSFVSDPDDPFPQDPPDMLNVNPSCFAMPCQPQRFVIPSKTLNKLNDAHFLRAGVLPGGADIRVFDVGRLDIGRIGQTTNGTSIGTLCVYSTVTFYNQIQQLGTSFKPNRTVSIFAAKDEAIGNGTQHQMLFNTANSVNEMVINGADIVNTGGDFTFPRGNYIVDCFLWYDAENNVATQVYAQLYINGQIVQYASFLPNVSAGTAYCNRVTLNLMGVVASKGDNDGHISIQVTANGDTGHLDGNIRFLRV